MRKATWSSGEIRFLREITLSSRIGLDQAIISFTLKVLWYPLGRPIPSNLLTISSRWKNGGGEGGKQDGDDRVCAKSCASK